MKAPDWRVYDLQNFASHIMTYLSQSTEVICFPAHWSQDERDRAKKILMNANRLLNDALLLETYERYSTALTLSVFALEEIGKITLRVWGEDKSSRQIDRKWSWHIRKQRAAVSLLQAEVALRSIDHKLNEIGVSNIDDCDNVQHEVIRNCLAETLHSSHERRLLEYVDIGVTERFKNIGLYVDDWALDHGLIAERVQQAELDASIDEVRRATRLLTSYWALETAKIIYITDLGTRR